MDEKKITLVVVEEFDEYEREEIKREVRRMIKEAEEERKRREK